MARRRTSPLIAVLLVLGALAATGPGHAATLNVTSRSLRAFTVTHPCPGVLAATTATTAVPVSTVTVTAPAACVGRTLTVAVNDGTTVRQGTVTAPASGSVTVTLDGAYTPSSGVQVAALVNGWYLATSWTYTASAGPAIRCWTDVSDRPCAATVVVRDSWDTGYNLDITIRDTRTTNGNNPVSWTIELDFANAQYPFVPNAIGGTGVVAASTCGDRPILRLTGVTGWGEHDVLRLGSTRSVWIQPHNDGAGTVLACVP